MPVRANELACARVCVFVQERTTWVDKARTVQAAGAIAMVGVNYERILFFFFAQVLNKTMACIASGACASWVMCNLQSRQWLGKVCRRKATACQ